MRHLRYAAWLVVVWVALWERATPANVLSGLAVAGLLLLLFPPARRAGGGRFRLLPAARFGLYFLWKLVEASAVVAWEVVTPRNRITEGVVAIPLAGVSDGLLTLVANAVSLTPGTVTLEADRDRCVLYVHVLHLRDLESVRREVRHLERLAVAAFGPDDVVRSRGAAGVPDEPLLQRSQADAVQARDDEERSRR